MVLIFDANVGHSDNCDILVWMVMLLISLNDPKLQLIATMARAMLVVRQLDAGMGVN